MPNLAYTIQSDDASLVLDSAAGFPASSGKEVSDDFVVLCESEKILVQRSAGTQLWQCLRGHLGTTAVRHQAGTAVTMSGPSTVSHVAGVTPTGGFSGDIKIGNGKIWVNDAGTWKSVAVA